MIVGICVEQLWIFHWQSPLILLLGFRLGLLCGFRASNCFLTPFTPMSSVCTEGNCDGPLDGMGSCSLVKTDLKWLFSVLAFFMISCLHFVI